MIEYCPFCDNILREDASFCGKCGKDVAKISSKLKQVRKVPLWKLVSPALWFWIILLGLNGLFSLIINLTQADNPVWDNLNIFLSAVITVIYALNNSKSVKPLLTTFGYKGIKRLEIAAGFLFVFVFMFLYLRFLRFIGFGTINMTESYMEYQYPFWVFAILLSVVPGIFEEIAFRGIIYDQFTLIGKENEAIIIQAVMFSILHMLPMSFISHFVLGLVFGLLRKRSKSLYPGMIVHSAWNFVVILFEYFKIDVF